MKTRLFSLLAVLLCLFTVSACAPGPGSGDKLENEVNITPVTGNEAVVRVVMENGMIAGAGYSDDVLRNKAESLTTTTKMSGGLFQYRSTQALHNYNVTYNNIRLQFLDWGWDETLAQKLTTTFEANDSSIGADVVVGETQMPKYMEEGKLEPFPAELEAFVRKNILPHGYKAMTMKDKNGTERIYGVAAAPSITVLVWNKAVLRNAGVDDKFVENGPATWSEWLEICKKLDVARKKAGGVYCGPNTGAYIRNGALMYMNGGSFKNEDGKAFIESDANAKYFEFLRKMAGYNIDKSLTVASEDMYYKTFGNGRIAFLVDGSWRIAQAKEEGNVEVGFCALPVPDNEWLSESASESTLKKSMVVGAAYLCVPTYSTNKENAFKVIQSYISKDVQEVMASCDLRPVISKEVGEAENYEQLSPKQSRIYKIMKTTEPVFIPNFGKSNSKVWTTIGGVLADVCNTGEDISVILGKAQKTLNTLNRG